MSLINRRILWIIATWIGLALPLTSGAGDNSDAAALVSTAKPAVAQLKAPTTIVAAIAVPVSKGTANGKYTLFFNSPQQWREEIVFPDYHEVRILSGSQLYIQRSTPYPPLPVLWLLRALHNAATGNVRIAKLSKVKTKKVGGIKARCVDVDTNNFGLVPSSMCFDDSGKLTASKLGDEEVEYIDYHNVAFPGSVRVHVQGRPALEIHVENMTEPSKIADTEFQPAPNVPAVSYCSDPVPPSNISKGPPQYPEAARASRVQGSVILYGNIGTGGNVVNLAVLASPSKDLAEASMNAVRNWTYEPAQCDGQPVQTETVITVHYSLSAQ